ncbi:S26 family signal peptidase [Anaerovoracaceae bacterium HCP3S3_H6]
MIQNALLIGVLAAFTGLISMIVILDMNPYVVVSGSMEPDLPVGSVCIIDCQQRSPDEGDIISYKTSYEKSSLD